jgi:hypothetical protein
MEVRCTRDGGRRRCGSSTGRRRQFSVRRPVVRNRRGGHCNCCTHDEQWESPSSPFSRFEVSWSFSLLVLFLICDYLMSSLIVAELPAEWFIHCQHERQVGTVQYERLGAPGRELQTASLFPDSRTCEKPIASDSTQSLKMGCRAAETARRCGWPSGRLLLVLYHVNSSRYFPSPVVLSAPQIGCLLT